MKEVLKEIKMGDKYNDEGFISLSCSSENEENSSDNSENEE